MTTKQRLFFKELLTGESGAGAARKAGYSKKSAHVSAHKNITKYNEFWFSLFVESGIDIGSLGKNMKSGLSSKSEEIRYKFTKLTLEVADRLLQGKDFNAQPSDRFNYSDEAEKRAKKYE